MKPMDGAPNEPDAPSFPQPVLIAMLRKEIEICNQESGLYIQPVTNGSKTFQSPMTHYGKFNGATNSFALVGKAGPDLHEKCGYWGERLVLKVQMMGLNTCWMALTFSRIAGHRSRCFSSWR